MRSHLLAFAAPAAAFLVVPEMMMPGPDADEAEGDFRILPADIDTSFALPTSSQSQSIKIPCLECPGQDATLRFDVNVHDSNKLLVNGFEVYPGNMERNEALMASVSTADGEAAEKELEGFMLVWPKGEDAAQGMDLLDINLRITGVAGVPVDSVSLMMEVIVGPNGEIMIADVSDAELEAEEEEEPPCEGWWCQVQKMWNELTRGRMGCHGAPVHMIANTPNHPGEKMPHEHEHGHEHGDGMPHEHHGPHPHGPHPHGPPHGPHGSHGHHLGKMIGNVAAHIFLPVVMGITAGIGAAVLAMFLCSVVSFIVKRLAGRETRYSWTLVPSQVIVIEEGGAGVEEDEKHGLLDGQAPPPAYEASDDKQ